ncbi:MAG: polysaccharide deacetylase family protein [Candidatus Brocadiia bacterium]
MARRMALTVDLEPDWGVRGTRAYREITPLFLEWLEARGIRATFFVVSNLLAATGEPVVAIGKRNEVASHGRSHRLLSALPEKEVLAELVQSRRRLRELGLPVRGFRAPFFRRTRRLMRLVRAAGYAYDASMGSVVPGPVNGRLHGLGCPCRTDGLPEFPTSAMMDGFFPLSLTWLRVMAPLSLRKLPRTAGLIYLHLHEFLPAETASCLPVPLRAVLTRNCGDSAWEILDRALDALDCEFTTCEQLLNEQGRVGSG